MHRYLAIFLGFYLLLAGLIPVHAQSQSTSLVSLYSLETDGFPTITADLDIFDSAGNVVTGLKSDAITLLEDNQPRPLSTFDEVQTGVEFALALDPGPTFAYRDANAITRYDKVLKAVKDWAAKHPDDLGDDLSLVPTYGVIAAHMTKTMGFSDALAAYQPNLQVITPSMDTLGHALDAVSEPALHSGMKRTVLFVTSPASVDAIPTLQNLTTRASAQHIRVDVWIVTSVDFFLTAGVTALKDLATQTGGQYVLFSGIEPLPGMEMYLAPLRNTYHLTYVSGVRTTGGHTLTVQANMDGQTVSSAPLPFELNLQEPNPVLVSMPEQIIRRAPDSRTVSVTAFLPKQQTIDIIVEFPDGRKRSLTRTTLLVDGQKVAENTAEPFDRFNWDLSGYATSGQHILSVEVMDSFGLSKSSLGVPVTVTIIKPKFGLLPFLSRNSLYVALIAILFSGVVLGVILAGGRIRHYSRPASRETLFDPLSQPLEVYNNRQSKRTPWKRSVKQPDAYLVRLKDDGQADSSPRISLFSTEMTFGSDPLRVTRILDDPSVSPVHARIQEQHGEYILSDEKSVAGTWVNYESLTSPRRLQHGDVLHFGRLSYRFILRKPPEEPVPKVKFKN